jgi:hypothetical protein
VKLRIALSRTKIVITLVRGDEIIRFEKDAERTSCPVSKITRSSVEDSADGKPSGSRVVPVVYDSCSAVVNVSARRI